MTVVEGIMNAEKYPQNVLEGRILSQMREWLPDGDGVFMQDGAPCHTTKLCKNFLSSSAVAVLQWPGNSPDLNPIETLRAILKMRLRGEKITNKSQMISALIKVWFRDDSVTETCKKLIDSMPERVLAVIAAKGGHTQY